MHPPQNGIIGFDPQQYVIHCSTHCFCMVDCPESNQVSTDFQSRCFGELWKTSLLNVFVVASLGGCVFFVGGSPFDGFQRKTRRHRPFFAWSLFCDKPKSIWTPCAVCVSSLFLRRTVLLLDPFKQSGPILDSAGTSSFSESRVPGSVTARLGKQIVWFPCETNPCTGVSVLRDRAPTPQKKHTHTQRSGLLSVFLQKPPNKGTLKKGTPAYQHHCWLT